VEMWAQESSDNRRSLKELQLIWDHSGDSMAELNLEKAYQSILQRTKQKEEFKKKNFFRKNLYTIRRNNTWIVAAIVLFALTISSIFIHYYPSGTAAVTSGGSMSYDRIISTEAGNRTVVILEDGTEVTLNASSELRVRNDFNTKGRHVSIQGEAFFKVNSDPSVPFFVHVGNASIGVIGTEFNVRAREDESSIEVLVREGKVSFVKDSSYHSARIDTNSYLLQANNLLRADKVSGHIEIQKTNVIRHLVWLEGGLYFQSMPFYRVVDELQKHYDVKIIIKDKKLLNIPYSGMFNKARIDEVLYVVAQTMGLEVRFNKDIIELQAAK